MTNKQERVVVIEPAKMNLLGLLMQGLMSATLSDDSLYARARSLRGDVLVRAGAMGVTLRFSDGPVQIVRDPQIRPRASVRGSMHALLGMVTGGGIFGPVLKRAVRIGGNPFLLLKMLPIIRAPEG